MTMKEHKPNGSEGADSFEMNNAESFLSGRQGGGSISNSSRISGSVMDDPPGAAMSLEAEEMSREISTANFSTNSVVSRQLGKEGSDGHSESTTPERKKKRVSFCRLISHRDFLDTLLMLIGTVGAIAIGCSQPFLTILFGQLVDALNFNDNASAVSNKVNSLCLKLLYMALGAGVASILAMTGWAISAERQAARLRCMYLQALLRQDVGYFDQEVGVGEALNKISGDIMLIQDAMGDKVASVIELSTRFCFGFGVGFWTNWKMTAVTIAAIPPVAIIGILMGVSVSKATNHANDSYSEAGVTVEQALGSIRTVASNAGEKKALEKYDSSLVIAETASIKLGFTYGIGLGAVLFVTHATYGLAMWYGSRLVADGQATAGEIIRVIFAVVMGGSGVGMVVPYLSGILAGLGAGYSMFQVIERKPPIDSEDLQGEILPIVKGEIQLKDVHFAYPTRPEYPVFTRFSLLIKAGSTTALVGESGSGKSTVIQLIERFYDPQKGQVLLDGVDIRELQLRWLRSQIALVSQEPVLFATSIRENIKYGKEDATHEEIEKACVLANAALFIDRMPQGYDTMVGDRGIQLSGGQKQRVAIARAILKTPRILLLDEATSALDAESEHMVQEALDRMAVSQTTVVIAHRLSTVKNASLIAVVQQGTVVEMGVHKELSGNPDSAYSQLIRFQETSEKAGPEGSFETISEKKLAVSGRFEGGSFRKPGRDRSSRRLSMRSHSRRGSSSRFSFVSDILSMSERSSSKHFDPGHVHDLLENESELGKEDKQEDIVRRQKISVTRLAAMNKPELLFFFFGGVGAAVVGASLPAFGYLLDRTIIALQHSKPGTVRHEGSLYASLFVVLGAVHLLFTPLEKINFSYAGERLLRRLRLQSFEKILRQEVSFFDEDRNSSAILSSRLAADAAAVRGVVGDAFCSAVEALTTVIVGFGFAFFGSWQLALIVLGMSPFLGMQGIMNISYEQQPNQGDQDNLNEAAQVASDAVSNIRTVASFSAQEKMVQLYARKSMAAYIKNIKRGALGGLTYGFANFCLFSGYAVSFYAGSKLVLQGKVDVDKVFLVILSIALSALGLANALRKVPELARCKPAIRSIFALLDRKSKIDPLEGKGVSLKHLRGRIDFKDVKFRYPTRPTVPVLQGLSFTLKSGTTLALVGGSGTGKSTVISLIERFYDPLSGSIHIDGVEIQALNITWLRQNIGLVSQEPVLFDDTIRGNILHGKGGKTPEDEVHDAARFANAHAFISALPDGYNTRVGERGIQLSGGQKQRVAIARAILKNPRILLLDEATSALDAESEHIVQEALDRIMVQRSTIIVAHRLSTVRNADQILVLKSGRIAEKGTYSELLSTGGLFATLARQTFRKDT